MRRVLSLALAVIFSVGMAVPVAAAKTKVRVISWYTVEPGGLLDGLKNEFEKANPDYEIEYSTVPQKTYYDQLQTVVAAGDPPEVAMLGFDWIAAMAQTNVIANIDARVRQSYPVNELFPPVQQALQYKGKYYALPRDISARVFYYNQTHVQEAGMANPGDKWTWDDFLTMAKRLTKRDADKVTRWGYIMDFVRDGHYSWYPTNSADWFNADRTKVTMTEPRVIETMQFLQDLVFKHEVTPNQTQKNAIGASGFNSQQASLQVGGTGVPSKQDFPDLNWGVANLPMKTQQASRLWPNLWVIPTGVKNTDAAWKVVYFFAGPVGQRLAYECGTGLPALRRVAVSVKYDHPYRDYLLYSLEVAVPFPVITNSKVWQVFDSELKKFWKGDVSANAIAESIQRQAEPLMAGK